MIDIVHSKRVGYHRIKQIIPAPSAMTAVFYGTDGKLIRAKVHILALVETYTPLDEYQKADFIREENLDNYKVGADIVPLTGDGEGIFEDDMQCSNLLGYEYDGEELTWEDKIKSYLERRSKGDCI